MIRDDGQAFQIAQIDHTEGGQIAASGRSYRDLHVGDILEGRISQAGEVEQSTEFTIAGITTYGRTVRSLGRMLTGVLLLCGRDGRTPRDEMLQVKTRPSSDTDLAHLGLRRTGEPR